MAGTIKYGRALFYPYIDFTDEKWVKTAALYYKGLNRIVPDGYDEFEDVEIIKQLNEDEEFVRNIDPERGADLDLVARRFLSYAKNELTNETQRTKIINKLNIKLSITKPYSIHMRKMGRVLEEELPELGLAVKDKGSKWYEFEPITGALYMTCLANEIAEKDSLPIVTDDLEYQPLIRGFQLDEFRGYMDVGETLAAMVIQSVIPQDIENISIAQILRLRKDYEDERHLFYNEINKLVKDLETVDSESVLKDALEARKKDIDIAVKTLDNTFKGIGIATGLATLGIFIPSFVSTLGFGAAAGVSVAVAAGKLAEKGMEYYKSRTGSPYSYVLSLKKELKPETFVDQLLRGKIIL